jgi:hypothetical protein
MGVVTRHAIDTVTLEAAGAKDGQGAPSFGSPASVLARVVLEDETAFQADGTEVKTQLTMWIPEGETWPEQGDRLTWQSVKYIVVERKERASLVTGTDHVRVRAREE